MKLQGYCPSCGVKITLTWSQHDDGTPRTDRMFCPRCGGRTGQKVDLTNENQKDRL